MKKNNYVLILVLLLMAMTLAACGAGEPANPVAVAEAPAADEVPTDVVAPEQETTTEQAAPQEVEESQASSTLPADLTAQLDAYLASQVYSDGGEPTGAAPGLVLLVDTPEGRYLKAAGVASLEDGTLIEVDDVLQIGSNTKSMLIVVMMQLQEEGLLSFDDKLSDWLPEQAAKIPNGEDVTLRQMANMATGFWDYGDEIIGEVNTNPDHMEKGYTPEEIIEYAVENGTPDFLPGEGWKYSNTNYILLGMIAEKASEQPLGQLFQERIFNPLGMESAVLTEGVPQEGELTTQGYYWTEDGSILNATRWNASQGWAAGANAMKAEDLMIYGKALAAGELFQTPESLAEMLDFNEDAKPVVGGSYGLGLISFDRGYWGHEGSTLGFQSLWYTNPEKGYTVVGLTNSGAYEGWRFQNVINILEGEGLQPFQSATLLPNAINAPIFNTSNWEWKQQVDSDGTTGIEPGIYLIFLADGTTLIIGEPCGTATGTFNTDAAGHLSFDLDTAEVTCTGDEPLPKLLDLLEEGGIWRFQNGGLVIDLAGEEGELIFFPPAAGE